MSAYEKTAKEHVVLSGLESYIEDTIEYSDTILSIHNDIEDFMKENELDETSKIYRLLIIPKIIKIVNIVILLFGLYTFKRQYEENM